ncbi:MAG: DUF2181 domain-containing protein [Candidatus Eremiobacterota bacterium]
MNVLTLWGKLQAAAGHVRRFVDHPPMPAEQAAELSREADDPAHAPLRWTQGKPLSEARNAHFTNTHAQMLEALRHPNNFLEGDIRLEGAVRPVPCPFWDRQPIMAHDPDATGGMTLEEWLTVGAASGRGLKLDIKQAASVPQVIEAVQRHGVPGWRMIVHSDVAAGPGAPPSWQYRLFDGAIDAACDLQDLRRVRDAFPDAVISLGCRTGSAPQGTRYTAEQLQELIDFGGELGGPIAFALRAEFVDQAAIDALKPHGSVGVWNDPGTWAPPDVEKETQRLRAMGVDGLIDLRPA